MTRCGILGAFFGSIAALTLAACGSTERMRYKMTVEVDTPEGIKSGYAVREIRYSEPPSVPSIGESRPQWRASGEAVAVDLSGGQTLFALLTSGDGSPDHAGRDIWFLFREFGKAAPDGVVELWPRVPRASSPRIADPLPMLVAFRDIADPKGVERVDPANLAAAFGPGMRLRRITVEVTDNDVTVGIERRLGWLPGLKGNQIPKKSAVALGPPYGLQGLNFSTESHK